MQPDQISQSDFLDILFEGRNKNYGAYELRKYYSRRLNKAILFTLSLCLLLIFGYTWAGRSRKDMPSGGLPIVDTISLVDLPRKMPAVFLPPAAHRTTLQQAATVNDNSTRIVPDDQVKPEDRPHTVEELNDVALGTADRPGIPGDNAGPVGPPNDGKGVVDAPAQNADDSGAVFVPIEAESTYKGGPAAWLRFLKKNFRPSEEAVSNGVQGTVVVQFIVDQAGNVSDVQAISGPEEYKQEAVRVIKKSGQWAPAIQNGRKVNSYMKQPIVVILGND